ncbi:odorant receptor 33a-like isoform X10 [Hermetia illucens]|uniref:odorant receptor 33a-like isoform X10 n=1 Tax=Hermetia illucens TaxID=343691 RepID=UPI0018CBF96F|nr:odorant receptor 33a-like isoform X10 [Hermetia illucens]
MNTMERIYSYEAFRIFWIGWKLQGIYTVENYRYYHAIHMVTIIVSINVITSIMFIGQLFVVDSFKDLLSNLTMGLCLIICGYKYIIFMMMRRHLVRIRDIWERLDVRPTTESQREYMKSISKKCNRLAFLMFLSYLVVNALFVIQAAFSHREHLAFPVWVPYDWTTNSFLFWMTWLYQAIAQFIFCVQQAANDVTGPIYLSVLTTHLRCIMGRIENLRHDPKKTDLENCKDLIDCIEDHRLIMDVFEILQGTVSYTILFQFIDEFVTAIYSTDWTDQGPEFKKLMIIFMEMTQQTKVIIAGKIIPVTLATFVSIMKISYSMFTVASQFQ